MAARDVENALEDTVSIFEAVLKAITLRWLRASGKPQTEIDDVFRKQIRNSYQNVKSAQSTAQALLGIDLFSGMDPQQVTALGETFEKRHPITHNLGIIDRTHLRRIQSGDIEGREIRIEASEVLGAVDLSLATLRSSYSHLFPEKDSA